MEHDHDHNEERLDRARDAEIEAERADLIDRIDSAKSIEDLKAILRETV